MISYDMERTVWNTPIALSVDNSENRTESSFEKNNFKNIELFETIQETFTENKETFIENLKVSDCSKKTTDKKNPVYAIKDIYKRACDGVTSIIMYQQMFPENLNDNEYKNMIQGSKWLQSRVGEFFVVLFTFIITFSVIFYSTNTFKTEYNNPADIITGLDSYTQYIQPINIILDLFLQDVLAPFTILLNLAVNFIPKLSNFGLSDNPHIFFIVLFGIFFGLVWAIYQNANWFLNMFFESFKWKINGIMFLIVFVHIFVRVVTKIIKPDNVLDEFLYRPKGLGPLIILLLCILIRILIALFLIPIAQMFFGFGFLLLFIIFPIGIGLLHSTVPVIPNQLGGFDLSSLKSFDPSSLKDSVKSFDPSSLKDSVKSFDISKYTNIGNFDKLKQEQSSSHGIKSEDILNWDPKKMMKNISEAKSSKYTDYWLTDNRKSDDIFDFKEAPFPILYSIQKGLGRIDLPASLFTKIILQNIIYITFIIFFCTQMTESIKYIPASDMHIRTFFIVYTVLNSFIVALLLYYMLSRYFPKKE